MKIAVPFARVFLVVVVVLCSVPANAQLLYGSLVGNVSDPSDAAIPGASVSLLNVGTGEKKRTEADARGAFLFRDLQPGHYEVGVAAPGFAAAKRTGVAVTVNNVIRADFHLELGAASERVTVSAQASELQTDRSDVNAQIGSREMSDLPLPIQRNYQSLLGLIPGVSPPTSANSEVANPSESMVMNVNGMPIRGNDSRVEGAPNSFLVLPQHVAYVPPAESIEVVNVTTNSFDAEQGFAGGASTNVIIKSGTNQYHGSVFEYDTNSALYARNFFYLGQGIPKNILNQFGFSVGGPILKNKLFFFGDYEGVRRAQSANLTTTVARPAEKSGNFSATNTTIYDPSTGNADGSARQPFAGAVVPLSRQDPASLKMVALLPDPNLPNATSNYFTSASLPYQRDNGDIKVNYTPSPKYSFFGRFSTMDYFLRDLPAFGQGGGPAIGGGQPGNGSGPTHSLTLGGTVIFSPHFLIDGYIGGTRQEVQAINPDVDKNYGLDVLGIPGTNGPDRLQGGYPGFTVTGYSAFGDANTANPFLYVQTQYAYAANASYIHGSHNIRFGGEYKKQDINQYDANVTGGLRGGFTFTGGLTALKGGQAPTQFNGFADFLLGLPQSMGKGTLQTKWGALRTPREALYVRDQWQATRNLTVNYGVRWEYYPYARRDHGGLALYDPTIDRVLVPGFGSVPIGGGVKVNPHEFAPRLGLAYRIGSKWVVRAGAGISIDPVYDQQPINVKSYPLQTNQQYTGATSFQAAGRLRTGIPIVAPVSNGNGIVELPPDIGDISVTKDLTRGYVESFNFTVQRELPFGFTGQAAYVGETGVHQMLTRNINAAPPGGGSAGRALYASERRTADIQMYGPFRTATYHSLQTQLVRRLSSGLLVNAGYTWSKSISFGPSGPTSSQNVLAYNWEGALDRNRVLSGWDRTQNFYMASVFEMPFGRGRHWASSGLAQKVISGWQLNAIFNAYSGLPFSVTSSATSLNAPGNAQTADQVLANAEILGGIGPGQSYFNPYAFVPVTAVRFGNTHQDVMRGPGLVNLNMGVFRNFRVTEKFKLQFRGEAINLSNTAHFNNPAANASSATRSSNGSIISLNGYTSITSAADDSRQIRLGLRVSF